MKLYQVVALAGMLCMATASVRGNFAVTDIGAGTQSPSSNSEVGWVFTISTDITVTHLGVWDADGDGLEQASTTVRIWTAQDNVLAQAEITAANPGTLINGFRYIDIDDVVLSANEGPFFISNNNWHNSGQTWWMAAEDTPPTLSSPITLVRDALAFNPNQFPFSSKDTESANLGPNFQYIPEPASLALLVIGAGAVLRRRA